MIINSGGYCKKCGNQSINYTIKNGRYKYFCLTCKKEIYDKDISIYRNLTKSTLGDFLSSTDETIRRNALSILKRLQKKTTTPKKQ